jgi:hypothetical protein
VEGIVKQGRGLMPGFQKLTVQHLHSLLSYLFNPYRATGPLPASTSAFTVAPASGMLRYRSSHGYMTSSSGLSPVRPQFILSRLTI